MSWLILTNIGCKLFTYILIPTCWPFIPHLYSLSIIPTYFVCIFHCYSFYSKSLPSLAPCPLSSPLLTLPLPFHADDEVGCLGVEEQCPSECHCEGTVVRCSRARLQRIPVGIPSHATELWVLEKLQSIIEKLYNWTVKVQEKYIALPKTSDHKTDLSRITYKCIAKAGWTHKQKM